MLSYLKRNEKIFFQASKIMYGNDPSIDDCMLVIYQKRVAIIGSE